MPEYDARAAARDRDSGLRKVSRFTWRAGAAGVAFSAVIGVALTHHGNAAASTQQQAPAGQLSSPGQSSGGQSPGGQSPAAQNSGGQQGSGAQQDQPSAPVQAPAQPPQQSTGNGQVTSGAS
jgi:hypothetical protein